MKFQKWSKYLIMSVILMMFITPWKVSKIAAEIPNGPISNVASNFQYINDKKVLNLSNHLKYLGQQAYSEGNISLAKQISTQESNLYLQYVSIHNFFNENNITNSVASPETSVSASIYGTEKGDINTTVADTIITSYESLIEKYSKNNQEGLSSSPPGEMIVQSQGTIPLDSLLELDKPIYNDDSNFYFTPKTSGLYQFSFQSPLGQKIEFDMWNAYESLYGTINVMGNKTIVTISLVAGVQYYIDISAAPVLGSVTKIADVSNLNFPVDIDGSGWTSEVIKFTPSETISYKFNAIGYGGFSTYDEDIAFSIYEDEGLTKKIAFGEYNLVHDLIAGHTYYIKIIPESGPSPVRIQVSVNNNADLTLNVPTDLEIQTSQSMNLEFEAPYDGTYKIDTSYINGINTGNSYDTMLAVYSENYVLLAYNDDSDRDTLFSGLTINLKGGTRYYIQTKGFQGIAVKARVTIHLLESSPTAIVPNTAYDINETKDSVLHFTFVPSSSDKYVLWTSYYRGSEKNGLNDTELLIYSDPSYNHLIAQNDNFNNSVFSRIETSLIAGNSYYITLKSKGIMNTRLRISTLHDSLVAKDLKWTIGVVEDENLILTWTPALNIENVKNYYIYNGSNLIEKLDKTADSLFINDPIDYRFKIMVRTEPISGDTSIDSDLLAIKLNNAPPEPPINLKIINSTETSLTLSWEKTDDEKNEYVIYVDNVKAGTTSDLQYRVDGLAKGKSYTFTVKTKDATGNMSTASENLTATIDITPPTAPTQVAVGNTTPTSILLTWKESTDNIAVTEYDIYIGETKIGTSSTSSYMVKDLMPNKRYKFTIKAKDSSGNVSISSKAIFSYTSGTIIQFNYLDGRLQSISIQATNEVISVFNYYKNGNLKSVSSPQT